MPDNGLEPRWKIVLRAWPPAGAMFLLLSFLVTAFWLCHAIFGVPNRDLNWLEPLAAILAGLGAFVLAAILIFRRVDDARAETDSYGLARGLATGYYFNFVRPLISALRDPQNAMHAEVIARGGTRIAGIIVGIPQAVADFTPARHDELLNELRRGPGTAFKLVDLEVKVTGRPRPISTKLAVSQVSQVAILVDIPTTLAVIPDFADFFARRELENSEADDAIIEARRAIVTASETERFQAVLGEFLDVINKVGSMESRQMSPCSLLHIVPLPRLRRRMDELAEP